MQTIPSCIEGMHHLVHAVREQELRNHLGSFGIKGSLATTPMRALSGGQAVRVGLAAVAFTSPHLLVLVRTNTFLDSPLGDVRIPLSEEVWTPHLK